ncbi:hypothetical protein GDO81_007731 [Engystomops pustulosus]|uniref:3CxxC-type domain-containing protein n=1 Tax=Engystomops pustulosus TaxID=76066 RepID=A0AAV7CAC3_ENGPU|nr:hypothetical protein GDO81_007731 [Engystomops pustulosus]
MDIWEDEFYLEIEEREVPGDWEFYEEEDLSVEERGLKYTQRTYGRFRCSGCRRTWYSAEVHILFLISLNKALQEGTMKMRIFRQECKKCNFPKLENPEISQENITRIIKNVVNRILQVFYGEKKAQQDLRPEIYSNDMEGPHESEHCEACKFMICKWQIVASENQSAVKNFPAQTRAAPEPNKQKKSKNRKSKGKKSSYGSTSTGSNQQSSYNCQPTTTYSDYKTYPNSEPDSEHLGYTEYVSACTNSVPAQSKVETKTHNSTAQTKAAPQQNNQKKKKKKKTVKKILTCFYIYCKLPIVLILLSTNDKLLIL